ncbi:hypothetical protein QE152_g8590 [Popillia japonica]|uniref:Endonuclease/exonuclease/phosphatase domain-containing protein n=1 Tax=Popillia japonica TaxID=7064 RepID=A0AAW1M1B6_POPJA
MNSPPTYENRQGATSHIDVTLANELAQGTVKDWEVVQHATISDHNLIHLKLTNQQHLHIKQFQSKVKYNIRKANWERLRSDLRIPRPHEWQLDVNDYAKQIRNAPIALRQAD